jgi:cobalt-zinc-cadmium efflux system outer membrane protein
VGFNVPLQRSRRRAGVVEASENADSGRELLEATRDRLRFAVQDSIVRLESIERRARLYAELIIPQAEESLASAEAAYTTNRQNFLDLLDAERVLFESRLSYQRLLADFWIATADLELALGRRFPAEGATP